MHVLKTLSYELNEFMNIVVQIFILHQHTHYSFLKVFQRLVLDHVYLNRLFITGMDSVKMSHILKPHMLGWPCVI